MTLAWHDDHIETDRLLLRRITEEDLPFLEQMHADPEVARYIGLGRPRSIAETRVWFDRTAEYYHTLGLGQLIVTLKSDGTPLGRAGISYFEVEPKPSDGGAPKGYFMQGEAPADVATHLEHELGYVFDRPAWGHGYAREAAAGVFDYVTNALAVDQVVSLIHPDNARSIRLVRSFGATREHSVRAFEWTMDRYTWPTRVRLSL